MTHILLDQNLSFKISKGIKDVFPDTKHLSDLNLKGANDLDIWNFAKKQDTENAYLEINLFI